jgi:hypothetical protein
MSTSNFGQIFAFLGSFAEIKKAATKTALGVSHEQNQPHNAERALCELPTSMELVERLEAGRSALKGAGLGGCVWSDTATYL